MNKILCAVILAFAAASARAEGVFTVGYSTYVVASIQLNSATAGATLINTRPSGFAANVGFLRISNPHPTWDIYVGGSDVSTDVFHAKVGQVIKANGGTADWPIARDHRRSSLPTPLYARPANSSGVDPLPRISVIWFGY